jgi:hypothetical protein
MPLTLPPSPGPRPNFNRSKTDLPSRLGSVLPPPGESKILSPVPKRASSATPPLIDFDSPRSPSPASGHANRDVSQSPRSQSPASTYSWTPPRPGSDSPLNPGFLHDPLVFEHGPNPAKSIYQESRSSSPDSLRSGTPSSDASSSAFHPYAPIPDHDGQRWGTQSPTLHPDHPSSPPSEYLHDEKEDIESSAGHPHKDEPAEAGKNPSQALEITKSVVGTTLKVGAAVAVVEVAYSFT